MTQFVVLLTEADYSAIAFRHTRRISTLASTKRFEGNRSYPSLTEQGSTLLIDNKFNLNLLKGS
jgi:hypothetical protein